MEVDQNQEQLNKKKMKLMEAVAKKSRANDFVDHIQIKCKKHGGPVTSVEELKVLLLEKKETESNVKSILKAEVTYQKLTDK